jgi:hypothetical protein
MSGLVFLPGIRVYEFGSPGGPRTRDLEGPLRSISPRNGKSEELIHDQRGQSEDPRRDLRGECPEELEGRLPLPPRVRALVVEVQLIGEGLAEQLVPAPKRLDVVELPLDEVMERFDIGVVRGAARRDAVMPHAVVFLHLTGEGCGGLLLPGADILRAVIGLEDQAFQGDPVFLQMLGDVGLEESAVGHRVLPGIGEEGRPGANLPAGELVGREPQPAHRGPIGRDILEVLHIWLELGERGEALLDRSEIPALVVAASTGRDQPLGPPDPVARGAAEGQPAFALQAMAAPSGQEPAEGQGLLLQGGRAFVGEAVGCPGAVLQPHGPLGLIAGEPFADRRAGRGKGPGRWTDPVLLGVLDHLNPKGKGIS